MQAAYVARTAHDTGAQTSRWERATLASGAVAGGLYLAGAAIFIGFIVPHMPALGAPAAEQAAFYTQQSGNILYRLVSYFGQAQMAFLILFFGGLFGVLRRAEGGSGSLAAAVFVAGSAIAVITPFAIMIEDHLLLGLAVANADPVVVRAFDGMGPLSFALSGFPQAVVLGGTAALLLSRRLIPAWTGWFGVALAVLGLLSTGTLVSAGLFPLAALSTLLFRVWLVALSLALVRGLRSVQ